MEPYVIGTLVGQVLIGALIAWLVIRAIIKVVRFNVIRKKEGAEAAQQFWDAKKKRRDASR